MELIYNDPTRHFGGNLDDAEVRLRHYLEVFERELQRLAQERAARKAGDGGPDRGECTGWPRERLAACGCSQ